MRSLAARRPQPTHACAPSWPWARRRAIRPSTPPSRRPRRRCCRFSSHSTTRFISISSSARPERRASLVAPHTGATWTRATRSVERSRHASSRAHGATGPTPPGVARRQRRRGPGAQRRRSASRRRSIRSPALGARGRSRLATRTGRRIRPSRAPATAPSASGLGPSWSPPSRRSCTGAATSSSTG